jgi:3-phenylpropionate/trans-cinnamate dioxygenase ferredoxin component
LIIMTDFVEAAALDQLVPDASLIVQVSGRSVALFNVDGTIYAINDFCAHAGASLGAGKIEGKMVTCRAHGLKYDITNGYVGGVPGFGVAAHEVKIVGGKIFVAVA